jgi:hypothetical protein
VAVRAAMALRSEMNEADGKLFNDQLGRLVKVEELNWGTSVSSVAQNHPTTKIRVQK